MFTASCSLCTVLSLYTGRGRCWSGRQEWQNPSDVGNRQKTLPCRRLPQDRTEVQKQFHAKDRFLVIIVTHSSFVNL